MNEDCLHCIYNETELKCRGCFEGSNYYPVNEDCLHCIYNETELKCRGCFERGDD